MNRTCSAVNLSFLLWLNLPRPSIRQILACPLRFMVGIAAVLLTAMPTPAAERIKFSYPPFGDFTVNVEDLEIFAKEGRITNNFAFYAQRVPPEQLAIFRQFLNRQFTISPVTVSQFTYSPTGEIVLERLGRIIQTEIRKNGDIALRSTLITTAANPKGFNAIDLLRQFPSRDIWLDLPASLEIANSAAQIFQQRDRIVTTIRQQAQLEAVNNPQPDLSNLPNLQVPGSQRVSRQLSLLITNPQRSVPVPVNLYFPQLKSSPSPVIVISHGIASDRQTFDYLAQHLTSYGFVVALLEHPETSSERFERFLAGLEGSPDATDIVSRPLDIRYLLDELERRNQVDPDLRGRMNLQQVGLIGQSFGGYTVLASGGAVIPEEQLRQGLGPLCQTQNLDFNLSMLLQCRATDLPLKTYDLRDDRVKAVIAINPVGSNWFGKAGLAQLKVPVMLISGTDDYFAPPVPEQVHPFSWLTSPNKYLLLVDQGTHFSFLGASRTEIFSVPQGLIGPSPNVARPYLQALSVAFFNTYLENETSYRAYLTEPYIESMSTPPLDLDLITSLTEAQIIQADSVPLQTQPPPVAPITVSPPK